MFARESQELTSIAYTMPDGTGKMQTVVLDGRASTLIGQLAEPVGRTASRGKHMGCD